MSGSKPRTFSMICTCTACATMVWSITRLSMFSIDQASSPISLAPTMRPLPFKVWNARRNSIRELLSSKFCAQRGKYSPMVSVTSPASSMKISMISSSISSLFWRWITGALLVAIRVTSSAATSGSLSSVAAIIASV